MEELKLTFNVKINVSLAPGDTLLFEDDGLIKTIGSVISVAEDRAILLGKQKYKQRNTRAGDFIFFSKAAEIEVSGIIGYEATTTITNDSTERAELYAISSEVFQSSI